MSILLTKTFNQDITFRKAKPADGEWAYQLFKSCIENFIIAERGSWDDQYQRDFLFNRSGFPTEESVIILQGGKPIGFTEIKDCKNKIWIPHMYLKQKARSQGIASFVIEKALELAKNTGKALKAETLRPNKPPQKLLQDMGFVQIGTEGIVLNFAHKDTLKL